MSTILYCLKQGIRNFIKNPLFTFASVATVSACIFLLSMFMILAYNLHEILLEAETNVGITVFFNEGITQETKDVIRREAESSEGVKEVRYTSADEAWDTFKGTYFGDGYEELSDAFEGENPLASSDSYEIFMDDIEKQGQLVSKLRKIEGVREVNYASSAVSLLKKINRWFSGLSAIIIGILLAVSVFLISNTINVSAVFRKRENEIMKLIGARNYMIRSPFVIEGVMIGILGALIPLAAVNIIYTKLILWLDSQLSLLSMNPLLQEILRPAAPGELRSILILTASVLGIGMGFFASLFTINRHLRSMK